MAVPPLCWYFPHLLADFCGGEWVCMYTCELVCMQLADISAVMGVSVQMETMSPFEGANVSTKSVIGYWAPGIQVL